MTKDNYTENKQKAWQEVADALHTRRNSKHDYQW